MKKVLKNLLIIVVVAILLVISSNEVFATKYDEENFKVEVADNYKQNTIEYESNKVYTYVDESNINNAYMIMQMKDTNYNKKFVDNAKLESIFGSGIQTKKKRLNGYDAVFIEGNKDGSYMKGYLLYSNNYNYFIVAASTDEGFLDQKETKTFFKSFKIKDSRFNVKSILGIITLIIIVLAVIRQYKSKIIQVNQQK